jgi:hypothetical protein
MSELLIHLESTSGSGFVVGEAWPAFSSTGFERYSFTTSYGQGERPLELSIPSGDYWIQLKLPTGAILRKLVAVLDQEAPVEVVVRIPDVSRNEDSTSSPFSVVEPKRSSNTRVIVGPIREKSAVGFRHELRGGGLPNSKAAPRFKTFDSAPDDIAPVRFAVDHLRGLMSEDGEPLLLKSIIGDKYSLSRVRASFLPWPWQSFTVSGRPGPGLVRPQTPDTFFKYPLRYASAVEALSASVQPDSLYARILRISGDVFEQSSKDIKDQRFKRNLMVIRDAGNHPEMLIAIPNGWGYESAGLRITRNRNDSRRPLKVSVEVKNVKFNALLQFMKGGDLGAAVQVIKSSVEMLYAKFDNPFAAAAAGYVLIQAAPETLRVPWPEWIGNLGRYFQSLPDGGILHATLLLQRGDTNYGNEWSPSEDFDRYFPGDEAERYKLAARLVLDSLGKGPPLFRAGLSLLASNILILRSVRLPEETKRALDETEKLVTWLSMRVDPVEPFSVFYLKD